MSENLTPSTKSYELCVNYNQDMRFTNLWEEYTIEILFINFSLTFSKRITLFSTRL